MVGVFLGVWCGKLLEILTADGEVFGRTMLLVDGCDAVIVVVCKWVVVLAFGGVFVLDVAEFWTS